VTSSEPVTLYGRRRSRVLLLVAVVALFLAATAFGAPRQLLSDKDRAYLSTDGCRGADRGRTCSATAGRR
jgi:hypothetical protein